MKTFNLTISRVDMPLYDGQAVSVTVPGVAGEMTLLSEHMAIISPLKAGTILVKGPDGSEESFSIDAGTLEMSNNHVTILV